VHIKIDKKVSRIDDLCSTVYENYLACLIPMFRMFVGGVFLVQKH